MALVEIPIRYEFLNLATVNSKGEPNVTPKLFLKCQSPFVYLVDASYGRTTENLRACPNVSLCFMNMHNLEGHRLNGNAQLIESGKEFDRLAKEVQRRLLQLSADRVIDGVRTGKRHEHFELELPERFLIIRVRVEETTRVDARGRFRRAKLPTTSRGERSTL